MNIVNLTRKFIPKLSAIKADNIEAVNKIPENILNKLIQNGDKSILQISIKESMAARINQNGIKTVFTDGLNECNGVLCVAKGLDGNPIAFPVHSTRGEISRTLNKNNLEKQLNVYDYYIDKNTKPKVFYNVSGEMINGQLKPKENPFITQLKSVFEKFFNQGYEEKIIPYKAINETLFDSKAMIGQFDKSGTNWKIKLTTVGEKEHFVDLWG